jgi:hypothetical protein
MRFLQELGQVNVRADASPSILEESIHNHTVSIDVSLSPRTGGPDIFGFDNHDESAMNHLKLLKIAQEKGKHHNRRDPTYGGLKT